MITSKEMLGKKECRKMEVLGMKELMQEDGGAGHERVNAGRWRCWA